MPLHTSCQALICAADCLNTRTHLPSCQYRAGTDHQNPLLHAFSLRKSVDIYATNLKRQSNTNMHSSPTASSD